jgi:glyoxylase-like metal-dependent hydrolase (beta-lactamase superfamily II)
LEPPRVYKKLDQSKYEVQVLERFPDLKDHLYNIKDGATFTVKEKSSSIDTAIQVIETPGHRSDHCSFSLKNASKKQNILFAGDMILGTPSVSLSRVFN